MVKYQSPVYLIAMSDQLTVEIGDTEVQITETEDGFEAAEVEDHQDRSGVWLKARSTSGDYGCDIPIDGDYTIRGSGDEYAIEWDSNDAGETDCRYWEASTEGHDRGAYVSNFEIIKY